MTYSQNLRKRTLMIAGVGVFTLLAGCATATTQTDTSATKPTMSMAEKTAMRTDCQAMHDTMMSGKTMSDMPGHKMMSSEMMEKHQTCMEIMPEMKAKMQEKCAAYKTGKMTHDMMGKGMMNHDKMEQHCAMMESAEDDAGQ